MKFQLKKEDCPFRMYNQKYSIDICKGQSTLDNIVPCDREKCPFLYWLEKLEGE